MFKLFLITVYLGATAAAPSSGESTGPTCKLPEVPTQDLDLQPLSGGNPMEDFDFSSIPDPFPFKRNHSVTIQKPELSGTFSFYNGLIEGLSTIAADYDYSNSRAAASLTVKSIQLTGIYEIIDAEFTIPFGGSSHSISGDGPVLAYGTGLNASVSFHIKTAPETNALSIGDLSIDIGFDNITLSVSNLVFDGAPVNFEIINSSIRSVYEEFWSPTKFFLQLVIEKIINKYIEGCTIIDLITWTSEISSKGKIAD